MPVAAKRPCATPGCSATVQHGHCPDHARNRDRFRGSRHERGYDHQWEKVRLIVLREQPICADPYGFHRSCGEVVPSKEVDHIIPIRTDPSLRLVLENLRGLCKSCHSRRTALESLV